MISSSNKGFTLIETLVVMVLLAMAGSLVFMSVGKSMAKRQSKAFGQQMFSLCKQARRMAVERGASTAVYISSTQRRCWVSGEKTNSLEIPAQMLVEGEGITQLNEDVYAVRFYPDGSSSGGELTFSIAEKTIYSLRVDMLTGLLTRSDKNV